MTSGDLRLRLRRRAARLLAAQKRPGRDPYFDAVVRAGQKKSVLFVSGPGRGSSRYRCEHQREQLELAGVSCDVGYYGELDLTKLVDSYGSFVLYRLPWTRNVERFLDRARGRGRTVVADADDLVFDPERAHLVQAVTRLPRREREAYEAAIARFRQTLAAVDGVVVSTDPLRAEAARVNDATAVAYNAVSAAMVAHADAALAGRTAAPGGAFTIAYLSGTATHDRDFLEAADGVLAALERYPNVRFLAAGFLSLDERFDAYPDRVVRAEYRRWERLPELLVEVDVNLAPLEHENAFTAAKSCVKYLEAGLVSVPTIASPTADFRRVIEPGTNGLLADNPDEWRDALFALIESPDLGARIGANARRDVLERHTTAARAEQTLAAFASLAPGMVSAASSPAP